MWGYASSPIIHEGKVFQLCGPGERQFLVALSLATGETLWEVNEPGGSEVERKYIGSWSSPLIVTVNGRAEVLCGLPTRVIACDPQTGEIVWYVTGIEADRGNLMYTSPLVDEQRGVALGGFGGPAIGFTLGGTGDMTEKHLLWRDLGRPQNPQRIGSGILLGEVFYIANADNEGSIECRNVADGAVRWAVQRTNGGPHWGSLLLANGHLYATGQKGITPRVRRKS